MKWLTPLGLLGLIGIAVLVLIYLLKPNYQQKVIPSTYVWKLSLKYKRKKIPISRLRNILILICQLLIITTCALILAQPYLAANSIEQKSEKIFIIDASANMLTVKNGTTRFDRAIAETEDECNKLLSSDGVVSVIVAGTEPVFLAQRSGAADLEEIRNSLGMLKQAGAYTYGTADMSAAMELASTVLSDNPEAEVVLYTGTKYLYDGNVNVVSVAESGEWNAAILECRSSLIDNYYSFEVDIASYGKDADVTLYMEIHGANDGQETLTVPAPTVRCEDVNNGGEIQTAVFNTENSVQIYAYDYVYFYIQENDDFAYDDSFFLYGGERPTVRFEYCCPYVTPFTNYLLMNIRTVYGQMFTVEITEMIGKEPLLQGFDFYIFEYEMPDTLPVDGVVMCMQPDKVSEGMGLTIGSVVKGDFTLTSGDQHEIMNFVNPDDIGVSSYTRVLSYEGYETLMYCGGDPVLLLQDTPETKIAILTFTAATTDLFINPSFVAMLRNLFVYFVPATFTKIEDYKNVSYVFEVDEKVPLRARGETLTVSVPGASVPVVFDTFPNELSLTVPGAYTFSQTLLSGVTVTERIYVKIPALESNINRTADELATPIADPTEKESDFDMLVIFAAVLVALVVLEWWLQSRENF